ncbi:murein biosynthesis integral membrane protein MurJ [Terribacillus saccharophilus]|uniref:Lipid II flippase n=1 Tax=Terribacillus saccharophilus TaxID=361277 RepID=A0ABX4GXU3_9BACI|nr:murein biosynthesis integral membrane protein MurJ [Terribacillus saccharophilus]PAD35230.1 murein biosynthesis integral membrane protein MurJ [Terribacillus saccharophilus]PAD95979.1 murein biosynthesis integral membrane protein MurJ [Terribacillus saccharophilus]PAD99697.1 murein biosynthesis integral membrane protein MurJ [Terribacillus saccharophilus]
MKSKLRIASLLLLFVTLVLKISGLIRDMLIGYYFGSGSEADAYLAAFALPNMFILFLTTGMKSAFVPSYIKYKEKSRGLSHLQDVWKGTLLFSLLISVVFIVIAPIYIRLLFPNLTGDTAQMATIMTIIFLSSLLFVGVNAVLEAYFDAENKYYLSVLAQAIVLLGTIGSALLFADDIGAYAFAFGNLAGVILSLLFKLVLLIPKRTLTLRSKIDWAENKRFYGIFIPVALTAMIGQITLLIDSSFANMLGRSFVTYLNFAKNLTQFPQNIVGVSIGTIIFPMLAAAYAKQDMDAFKANITRGLQIMYFVLLPVLTGMMLLMPEIVSVLFERGKFNSHDVGETSIAAYYYFGTILFYSLVIIVNNGFYTMEKGHYMMRLGFLSIGLKLLLNYLFTESFGFIGIPLSSSVTGLIYAVACFLIFRKLTGGIPIKGMLADVAKTTASVLIMGIAVLFIKGTLSDVQPILTILICSAAGVIVFLICVFLMKIKSFYILLGRGGSAAK